MIRNLLIHSFQVNCKTFIRQVVRRLTAKSLGILKPEDIGLKLSDSSEIW